MNKNLQFFWLWYNEDRKNIIDEYGGQYLNLSTLKIDYLPQESLQESCIYFSNIDELFLPNTSHLAFASARYKEKFSQCYNDPNVINLSHDKLLEIIRNNYTEDYLPFHTNGYNWYNNSELYHPGINKFIDNFIEIIDCHEDVKTYNLGMSNSFMIQKELFLTSAEIFRYGVKELYNYYNDIEFGDCGFKNRKLGCLWERLAGISVYAAIKL